MSPTARSSSLMCRICYGERVLALIGEKYLMAPCSVVARRMAELQVLNRDNIISLASDIGRRGGLPQGLTLNAVRRWLGLGLQRVPCDCTRYRLEFGDPVRDSLG